MAAKARKVPESLSKYRSMRKFDVTPEPSGSETVTRPENQLSFCIQKHDATHLHYDFRLELDGVLKSWAVAKGPSFMPSERRLAVEVEDHPLAYGAFEGIIPKGQYGGGTVMLWDRGTWTPLEEPHAALKKGAIKFELHGEKLTGHWTLVRMPPREKDRHPNWLLIKEKDEVAKPEGPSLPENDDESVLSRRTMQQIADAPEHVWESNKSARQNVEAGAVSKPSPPAKTGRPLPKGEVKSSPLEFISPELATLAEVPPSGNEWLHEIKFDGYRLIAAVEDGKATLYTRKGLDWSKRFPEIRDALARLPGRLMLDGEVVVLKPDGTSDFSALQARLAGESNQDFTFFVFDLLHRDGADLRSEPLAKRKEMLSAILAPMKSQRVVYCDHVQGSGSTFLKHGCAAGLEGIVSKKADAPYRSGRIGDWLKIKCAHRQEFVIGGYVPPTTGMKGIGSLSVGHFQDGKLAYAGRIGTGYTEAVSRDLRKRLDAISAKQQPFAGKLPREATRDVVWVKPELVAEISFTGFTDDGMVRHGAFKGLREDKAAPEVTLEITASKPVSAAKPVKSRDEIEIGGVRLTHPDKIVDVESGLTKERLAQYYIDISEWILPHVVDRPLSIVRCPDGSGHPCFYQRHIATGSPTGIHTVETGKEETFLSISDLKGLVSLVQVGALELHPWGAPNAHVDKADHIIFDLDPDPSVNWSTVVETAFEFRDRLKKLGLESFVKTTGGKGLHVTVPLDGSREWNVVKKFAHDFAQSFADQDPAHFIAIMSKAARKGKIFIDYLRNDRTATAVCPYSTRARAGAPVATPLSWKELESSIDPHAFTVEAVQKRLAGLKADPWKGYFTVKQACPDKA
jgi:bifunctional non-homologous end joining protein LigD